MSLRLRLYQAAWTASVEIRAFDTGRKSSRNSQPSVPHNYKNGSSNPRSIQLLQRSHCMVRNDRETTYGWIKEKSNLSECSKIHGENETSPTNFSRIHF